MSTPERAGWYDDPEDETQLRYFDGIVWSDRKVPRQTRSAQQEPANDGAAHEGPGTDVFGRPSGATAHTSQQQWGTPGTQQQWGTPQQSQGWGQPASVPAEPTTEDGQPLAGYGVRVGAYVIDLLVVGLINAIVAGWAWYLWMADYWSFVWDAAAAGDQEAVSGLEPEELLGYFDWRFFFVALGLTLLVQVAYHVGFLATRSATPGKMVLGLSVRRTDRPGRLGVGTAFMRMVLPLTVGVFSMVPLLSYLLWFVSIADLVWPIKDSRRQALHDKIAGTQVVRGAQPSQEPERGH